MVERVGSRTGSLACGRVLGGPRAYVLLIDAGACRVFELPGVGELSIGRDADCDVVIDDAAVSRRHARLIAASGMVRIADLGSRTGTQVNGVRVDGSRILTNGDDIAIGEATLVVHAPWRTTARAEPAAATAPAAARIALGDREVIVADPAMARIYELLARLGRGELSVLVCGETGVGKENAAFAVHHGSPRRSGPFVAINCAALPESLVEAELFGHEKGAFSGAIAAKPGLFEAAAGGTVFLDEVGELPWSVQAKLLRAVEARRVTRVGGLRELELDVRIVAATNRDLDADVRAGRFRRDLLFRLNVATVVLPPLRERPREIGVLARVFLEAACRRIGRTALALSESALQRLASHPWPGNVRELRNAMELVAATATRDELDGDELRLAVPSLGGGELDRGAAACGSARPDEFQPITEELNRLEALRMNQALAASGGIHTRAAALIAMPIRTFTHKLKRYGLSSPAARPRRGRGR